MSHHPQYACPIYRGPVHYIGEILTMRPSAAELRELEAHGMAIEEAGDRLWQVVASEEARAAALAELEALPDWRDAGC